LLLLAIAVVDDVGAILVIAFVYSPGVHWPGLAVAAAGLLGVVLMQLAGIRGPAAYLLPGLITWAGTLASGIHPTIAGVCLGLLAPVRAWYGRRGFLREATRALGSFRRRARAEASPEALLPPLRELENARREAVPPALRMQHALHPWVAYLIMPLFALANAGVRLQEVALSGVQISLGLGVLVGLVLGKPLGVLGASLLAVRTGLCELPTAVTSKGLLVVGMAAGIGFTMSLFIAALAFEEPRLLGVAKTSVFAASFTAVVLVLVAGRWLLRPREPAA
jgi:NhaA family Na+:H+ antiporter